MFYLGSEVSLTVSNLMSTGNLVSLIHWKWITLSACVSGICVCCVSMCVMCVCLYLWACVWCVCLCKCMHICMCVYVCVLYGHLCNMCAYLCVSVFMCVWVYLCFIWACVCLYMYVCLCFSHKLSLASQRQCWLLFYKSQVLLIQFWCTFR